MTSAVQEPATATIDEAVASISFPAVASIQVRLDQVVFASRLVAPIPILNTIQHKTQQ